MTLDINLSGIAAVTAFNLLAFWGTAPLFLNRVHHHWVVPAFCGLLFAEAVFLAYPKSLWTLSARRAVLTWAALTGIILFWRQFSMFECYMHCGTKLAAGLLLLAGGCAFLWKSFEDYRWKNAALCLVVWFVLWLGWVFVRIF